MNTANVKLALSSYGVSDCNFFNSFPAASMPVPFLLFIINFKLVNLYMYTMYIFNNYLLVNTSSVQLFIYHLNVYVIT